MIIFKKIMAPVLIPLLLITCISCTSVPECIVPVHSFSVPDKSTWSVTVSGNEDQEFPGGYICDDRWDTRWSSPHQDGQWVQIDLGQPALVSGFELFWEAAYAREYAIQASLDGITWISVYHTALGDGQKDDLYIKPQRLQYFRVECLKRATSWGNSIWEVNVKDQLLAPVLLVNDLEVPDANLAMDGKMDTEWLIDTPDQVQVDIDLKDIKEIGGVRVDWGDTFPVSGTLSLSTDDENWTEVDSFASGRGNYDLFLHEKMNARFLRMNFSGSDSITIREISLRGPNETVSSFARYQSAARKARPGMYADQLHGNQVYWTIVGLPGDDQESLLDEYGNLESVNRAPSIMPYLYWDGQLMSAFDVEKVDQKLAEDYLPMPSVIWHWNDGELRIQTLVIGPSDASVNLMKYTIRNDSSETKKGRLFLALRPMQINPVWQHGGFAPIGSAERVEEDKLDVVRVNDQRRYVILTPVDQFALAPFDSEDIIRYLRTDRLPEATQATDPQDLLSGAFAYSFELAPGQETNIVFAAPLHDSLETVQGLSKISASWNQVFDWLKTEQVAYWKDKINQISFKLGDKRVERTVKSQLAYILINQDGVVLQPGARNYNRAWIRDGSLTCAALVRMGLGEESKKYLDWYGQRVRGDGLVPPILNTDGSVNTGWGADNEYDSQGQYIFAIMDYYRLTGDQAFLERHYDRIVKALHFTQGLREKTSGESYKADEPASERYRAILPPSISHEGYPVPVHSYWDVYFALKGWRDGMDAAKERGDKESLAWMEAQWNVQKQGLLRSLQATIDHFDISYIPGSAERGDPDATSVAISLFPCGLLPIMPEPNMHQTFTEYMAGVRRRSSPEWSGRYTPYEVRNLLALTLLGMKEEAWFLNEQLLNDCYPPAWNHFAEVVNSTRGTGVYIGDMPHTWVGADYVNAIRGMLVHEDSEDLFLFLGTPESWVKGEGVDILGLPTAFGRLNLSAVMNDQTLNVTWSGVQVPGSIHLSWPNSQKPNQVSVNGEPISETDFDQNGINLTNNEGTLKAQWGL